MEARARHDDAAEHDLNGHSGADQQATERQVLFARLKQIESAKALLPDEDWCNAQKQAMSEQRFSPPLQGS